MSEEKIEITLDEGELTIGDMEIIDEVAGGLTGDSVSELKMTLALVLMALRKQDPEATLDDARAVKLSSPVHLTGDGDEVDPTD